MRKSKVLKRIVEFSELSIPELYIFAKEYGIQKREIESLKKALHLREAKDGDLDRRLTLQKESIDRLGKLIKLNLSKQDFKEFKRRIVLHVEEIESKLSIKFYGHTALLAQLKDHIAGPLDDLKAEMYLLKKDIELIRNEIEDLPIPEDIHSLEGDIMQLNKEIEELKNERERSNQILDNEDSG